MKRNVIVASVFLFWVLLCTSKEVFASVPPVSRELSFLLENNQEEIADSDLEDSALPKDLSVLVERQIMETTEPDPKNSGSILGPVVGGGIVLIILIVAVFFFIKHKNKENEKTAENNDNLEIMHE